MKKFIFIIVLLVIAALGFYKVSDKKEGEPVMSAQYDAAVEEYKQLVIDHSHERELDVKLQGKSFGGYYRAYLDNNLTVMIAEDFLEDVVGCSVIRYSNKKIRIDRGENTIIMKLGEPGFTINGDKVETTSAPVMTIDGNMYFPTEGLFEFLDLEYQFDYLENYIDIRQVRKTDVLPAKYDLRDVGRVTTVRDQGRFGTCWAFASLGALETTLMPLERNSYSTEHMTLNNSYNLDLSTGGEHTVSIAYLAAWQGPVYERDDVYGDGVTDKSLKAVKHLEEAIVIKDRNDATIKTAIFRYGGVETSLFLQMEYTGESSDYYNEDAAAYYYDEEKSPNHDIVIVGWDDNYPRSNFKKIPEHDGAYICKNSWGTEFGEKGYFYVSYDDVNICSQSIVYTRLAEADNFDNIYQSDLLGWVGQIGFGSDNGYFANCYTAKGKEKLKAVSFYATDEDTEFAVYVVHDYESDEDLKRKVLVSTGETRYSGYYTVRFEDPEILTKGEKYAVIVYVKTPGSTKPIAIEYRADKRTEMADISDGEGYISLYGEAWHSVEKTQNCNVCLKAFTDNVDDETESGNSTGKKTDKGSGNTAGKTTESATDKTVENVTGNSTENVDGKTTENVTGQDTQKTTEAESGDGSEITTGADDEEASKTQDQSGEGTDSSTKKPADISGNDGDASDDGTLDGDGSASGDARDDASSDGTAEDNGSSADPENDDTEAATGNASAGDAGIGE